MRKVGELFGLHEQQVQLADMALLEAAHCWRISLRETTNTTATMPYKIERKRNGVIKRFSGVVTFDDVLKSEQEISSHPDFRTLHYVISDYIGTDYKGIAKEQGDEVSALRIGAHLSNPRIRYAFVIQNPEIREQIKDAISQGLMLFETKIFDTYEQAAAWVGL